LGREDGRRSAGGDGILDVNHVVEVGDESARRFLVTWNCCVSYHFALPLRIWLS